MSQGHDRGAAPPWSNPALPPRARAQKLLAAMTLQEKLHLLQGGRNLARAGFSRTTPLGWWCEGRVGVLYQHSCTVRSTAPSCVQHCVVVPARHQEPPPITPCTALRPTPPVSGSLWHDCTCRTRTRIPCHGCTYCTRAPRACIQFPAFYRPPSNAFDCCLPACLPVCLPACLRLLPAFDRLPACLPACLMTHPSHARIVARQTARWTRRWATSMPTAG